MEGINDQLKAILGHFPSQQAVAEHSIEDTVDVITDALVLPEHLQDGCDCHERILGPI
jgi:hypothetical protein